MNRGRGEEISRWMIPLGGRGWPVFQLSRHHKCRPSHFPGTHVPRSSPAPTITSSPDPLPHLIPSWPTSPRTRGLPYHIWRGIGVGGWERGLWLFSEGAGEGGMNIPVVIRASDAEGAQGVVFGRPTSVQSNAEGAGACSLLYILGAYIPTTHKRAARDPLHSSLWRDLPSYVLAVEVKTSQQQCTAQGKRQLTLQQFTTRSTSPACAVGIHVCLQGAEGRGEGGRIFGNGCYNSMLPLQMALASSASLVFCFTPVTPLGIAPFPVPPRTAGVVFHVGAGEKKCSRRLDRELFSFETTHVFQVECNAIKYLKGAAVAERLAYSPPVKANRATPGFSRVGIVPDGAAGRRVFSGISRFPRPFISVLLHSYLISPRELPVFEHIAGMQWRGETGFPRENPPTNGIVRHDSHMRESGVTRPGIEPGSP
ncbi:hypothetical protein PR048_007931 [Dryococelus australis]|uniref:Uncharacterized protein n=1 Tax=Dryococelus australis TaxID=614101 RepID=A0ABQ9HWH3_9NEOP|nr:hypothetical protein PR048_007931 [Dryococelus australis]